MAEYMERGTPKSVTDEIDEEAAKRLADLKTSGLVKTDADLARVFAVQAVTAERAAKYARGQRAAAERRLQEIEAALHTLGELFEGSLDRLLEAAEKLER